MNTFASLFQQLFNHIGSLWPLALIRPWEQGVRMFAGRIQTLLTHENGIRGTGLHWHWPLIGEIYTLESNIEIFETEAQTIRTLDGKDVTFTLGLQCRITRLDLFYEHVNDDLKSTVADAVRAVAGETAAARPFSDLGAAWVATVRDLAAQRMSGWGVRLLRVSTITCTTSPVLRVIGVQGDTITL